MIAKTLYRKIVFLFLFMGSSIALNAGGQSHVKDVILFERNFHLIGKFSDLNIRYNRNLGLSGEPVYPIKSFVESLYETTEPPMALNSFVDPYGDSDLAFRLARSDEIYVYYEAANIQAQSTIWKTLTTFADTLVLTEYGTQLRSFGSTHFEATTFDEASNDFFSRSLFPTVCSSVKFKNFTFKHRSTGKTDYSVSNNSNFFVEPGPQSSECLVRLFLDFLGLRGLAIAESLDEDLIRQHINFLAKIEEPTVFKR